MTVVWSGLTASVINGATMSHVPFFEGLTVYN